MLADAAAEVVQSNQFYPFGLPYVNGIGSGKQPYKYSGKEQDNWNGLNIYDFEARRLNTVIPMFTTQDPLSEKYYEWSPYVYVMNNPMNHIDPTGMDIWQVNENGKVVNWIQKDNEGNRLTFDRIEVLNHEGNITGYTNNFNLGTITQQSLKYTDGSDAYNIFTVQGYANAKNVFETLANPDQTTGVEWSHLVFGTINNGSVNFVSISYQTDTEGSARYLIEEYQESMPLLEHTHNHVINSFHPSGLIGGQRLNEKTNQYQWIGDMGAMEIHAEYMEKKYGITPHFKMYNHKTKKRIRYTLESKVSDF